jgi:2-polyprenyl-6-hydroxyphenyl methylase/3-demethylubiquinone-9 3-methyltransferase
MPLGPAVRRLFGRHEHRIAELYRAIFVDIDAYARQIGEWAPAARHILEVGCGEGAVTERLAQLYPDADILAIDITPRVGRLFRGRRDRVRFVETTVQQVAATRPGAFDLVILSDVLHHVPPTMRRELLAAVRATIAPGGALIFKDWERNATPIHWLCHAGDRWLTGDRVRYLRKPDAEAMLADAFGRPPVVAQARVRPWRNNFAMLARI